MERNTNLRLDFLNLHLHISACRCLEQVLKTTRSRLTLTVLNQQVRGNLTTLLVHLRPP